MLIDNSTMNGGTLRATGNAASAERFAGDATLTGVTWEDPGAGEFHVYNATARLHVALGQRPGIRRNPAVGRNMGAEKSPRGICLFLPSIFLPDLRMPTKMARVLSPA